MTSLMLRVGDADPPSENAGECTVEAWQAFVGNTNWTDASVAHLRVFLRRFALIRCFSTPRRSPLFVQMRKRQNTGSFYCASTARCENVLHGAAHAEGLLLPSATSPQKEPRGRIRELKPSPDRQAPTESDYSSKLKGQGSD